MNMMRSDTDAVPCSCRQGRCLSDEPCAVLFGNLGEFADHHVALEFREMVDEKRAVQVGEPLRLFTVDCSQRSKDEDESEDGEPRRGETEEEQRDPIVMINPEIVAFSDTPNVYEEGCLSIPDYYADVERPAECTVKFVDRDGKEQLLEADGLLATCIQHEFDHLNGTLFIDHLSKLKRDMVVRKFTKIAKQNGTRFIG